MTKFKEEIKEEIDKYKWFESELAKRDLGKQAIITWIKTFYNSSLRKFWLLHIQGIDKIDEFPEEFFNICNIPPLSTNLKTKEVIKELENGGENLTILYKDVSTLEVLLVLKINEWRINPIEIIENINEDDIKPNL